MPLSVSTVREHIPLLKDVIYLDNCNTTPVPKPVLDAMLEYFECYCVNVGRGGYSIAERATHVWDEARRKAARLLLNCELEEFIFTRNATQASCFVAYALQHPLLNTTDKKFCFAAPLVKWDKGDEIVFGVLDHHSNILPWIRLAYHVGAEVKVVECTKDGLLTPEKFDFVTEKTRFVALQHISNVFGTVHPVKEIIKRIKENNSNCLVYVDGAQGPGHMLVDVNDLNCDFYGFSGHKGPLGPQGSGGLYVRKNLMGRMEPEELGGGTIADVSVNGYKLRGYPLCERWEAGTPNIPGLIGLGRAAEYVAKDIGISSIEDRERELTKHLLEGLKGINGVEVYGPTQDLKHKTGIVSFNLKGWVSHEVMWMLDEKYRILVRAGHHCAIPVHHFLGVLKEYAGSVRVSFHYYNTHDEVDAAINAIREMANKRRY